MSTYTHTSGPIPRARDAAGRPICSPETMRKWIREVRTVFNFNRQDPHSQEAKEWNIWRKQVLDALDVRCSRLNYDDQERLWRACKGEEGRAKLAMQTTHATELDILKDMVKHVGEFLCEAGLEARPSSSQAAHHTAHPGVHSPLLAEEMTAQDDPDYDTFSRSGYSANSLSKFPLGLTPRKARFYGFV